MNTSLLPFQIPHEVRVAPRAFFFCEVNQSRPEITFAKAAPCGVKAGQKQESSEALEGLGVTESTKESIHLA